MPHIKTVFHSNDDIWKNWVLLMLRNFPSDTVRLLTQDIQRMGNSPTASEALEETDKFAQEIIKQFQL